MSLKLKIASIILAFFPIICDGQNTIDSLKSILRTTTDEKQKVIIFQEISKRYENYNFDSALFYGHQGLDIAEKISVEYSIAEISRRLGVIYRNNLEYGKAYEYLNKSIELYEELENKSGLFSAYTSFANLANDSGLNDIALDYYFKALGILVEMGYSDSLSVAQVYLNIGTAYSNKSDFPESNRNIFLALKIIEDQESYESLVPAYLNLGHNNELESKFLEAELDYLKGLEFASRSENSKTDSIDVLLYLGRLYNKTGKFQQAYQILSDGYNLAMQVGRANNIRDYSEQLATSLDSLGKDLEAFKFYKKFHDLDKEVGKNEIDLRLSGKIYETQIREQAQITQKIKFRNRVYIVFLGLFVLLILILYRNFRIKQKANKLLSEMDGLKSRLFSNISHEFRTPLTLILGPLEDMLAEETSKKPTQKTVKMMQRNANRLLDLVNQMLDLSKVDAGSMKLELEESDILKSFRVILSSFNSLAEKKEILFKQSIPVGTLLSWFDEDKIEKILTNLLSNAFKFTPEGGTVACEVTPSKDKKSIKIEVSDTGMGIAPDQQEKIFDRFHQVEKSGEPESIGTGIGLALTKELVVLMHGELSVKSKVGEGTSFTVALPLGKNHLDEDEYTIVDTRETKEVEKSGILTESLNLPGEESLEEEAMEESKLPLVLTVEDNEDIRTHIREHLEDYCRVMEAGNGEIGLDKAIESIPDLIITDLMMPKMNGVEMCKKLKTDERTSHIPVIMLTAKADVDDRIEGLETGADAYVTKPFSIKELRVRVNKLIEQRQKLRERFSRNVKLEPRDIAITSADETFLNRAMEIIETHMGNSEFEVRDFQVEMGMSRMQLFRKVRALTDHSPSEFIRNLRLKRAAKLMEQNYGNIAQITYKVGFNNLSYFAKCFKKLFEISPSEYLKKHSQ